MGGGVIEMWFILKRDFEWAEGNGFGYHKISPMEWQVYLTATH